MTHESTRKSRGWRFSDEEVREIKAEAKAAGVPVGTYLVSCHRNKKQVLDVAKFLRNISLKIDHFLDQIDRRMTAFEQKFEIVGDEG